MTTTRIHPTAIIDPGAELGVDVEVGPWALVGPGVEVGDHCRLGPRVTLQQHVRLASGVTREGRGLPHNLHRARRPALATKGDQVWGGNFKG